MALSTWAIVGQQVKSLNPGSYDDIDDEVLGQKLSRNPVAMAKFQADKQKQEQDRFAEENKPGLLGQALEAVSPISQYPGVIADYALTGGKNIVLDENAPFLSGGIRLNKNIGQHARELVERGAAAAATGDVGQLNTYQPYAGEEEHVRKAVAKENPVMAGTEAVLGTIGEKAVDFAGDPLLWTLGGAGKIATRGGQAAGLLKTGAAATPQAAAALAKLASQGKLAGAVATGAGAAFVPGMVEGAIHEGGEASTKFVEGDTVGGLEAGTSSVIDALFATLGAKHTASAVRGGLASRGQKPVATEGTPDPALSGPRHYTVNAPSGSVDTIKGQAAKAAAELVGGGAGAMAASAMGLPSFVGRAPGGHFLGGLVSRLTGKAAKTVPLQAGVPRELKGIPEMEIDTALSPFDELIRTQRAEQAGTVQAPGMSNAGEFGRPFNEFEMTEAVSNVDRMIGEQQENARAAQAAEEGAPLDPVAQAQAELKQLAVQNRLKAEKLKAAELTKKEAEAQRLAELEAEHPDLPGLVEKLAPPNGPLPYAKAVEQARAALGLPPKAAAPAGTTTPGALSPEEAAAGVAANDPFQTAENIPAGEVGARLAQAQPKPSFQMSPEEQAQLISMLSPELQQQAAPTVGAPERLAGEIAAADPFQKAENVPAGEVVPTMKEAGVPEPEVSKGEARAKELGIERNEIDNHAEYDRTVEEWKAGKLTTRRKIDGTVRDVSIPLDEKGAKQMRAIARGRAVDAIVAEREAASKQQTSGMTPEQQQAHFAAEAMKVVEELKGNEGAIRARAVALGYPKEAIDAILPGLLEQYRAKKGGGDKGGPPPVGGAAIAQKFASVKGEAPDLLAQMKAEAAKTVAPPTETPIDAAKKQAGVETDLERAAREAAESVTEEPTAPTPELVNNASAESGSGGSAEALSRTKAMSAKGQKFVRVDKAGNATPSNEDGGINLPKGQNYGILSEDGTFQALERNGGSETVKKAQKAPSAAAAPAAATKKAGKPAEAAKAQETAPEASGDVRAQLRALMSKNDKKTAGDLARKSNPDNKMKITLGGKQYGVGDIEPTSGRLILDVEEGGLTLLRMEPRKPGEWGTKGGSKYSAEEGQRGGAASSGSPKGRSQYSVEEDFDQRPRAARAPAQTELERLQNEAEGRGGLTPPDPDTVRPFADDWMSIEDLKKYQPTPKGEKQYSAEPDKLGFYSHAEKVVSDPKAPKKQHGKAWDSYLRSPQRGVTKDEMYWTGLDDFLRENADKPVTSEQISQYLKANKVEIIERGTTKDVPPVYVESWTNDKQVTVYAINASGRQLEVNIHGTKDGWTYDHPVSRTPYYFDTKAEAIAEAKFAVENRLKQLMQHDTYGTRHASYQEPGEGGARPTNYREIRISVPKTREGENVFSVKTHYDEPGIVTTFRVNSRKDVHGKKVLFVEEIQSDAGSKAAKEGVKPNVQKLAMASDVAHEKFVSYENELRNTHGDNFKLYLKESENAKWLELGDAHDAAYAAYSKAIRSRGPSNAPFITSTQKYTDLATKRLLRIAAEEGYDRIAWTPGRVQNRRWSITQVADQLYYDNRTGHLQGFKGGDGVFSETVKPEKLADYVGNDVAAKLTAQEGLARLDKSGLEVGESWANDYYDKIIPGSFEKVGKRFGAKVGKTNIEFTRNHESINSPSGFWVADGMGNPIKWEVLESTIGNTVERPAGRLAETGSRVDRDYFETREAADAFARQLDEASGITTESNTVQSIEITPEMREGIVKEGFPQYKAEPKEKGEWKPPTMAEIKKNLPKGLADGLVKLDDGTYEIETPRGVIVIRPTPKIEVDLAALEAGHGKESVAAYERGEVKIPGEKTTFGGKAIVNAVESGVLPHEVGGHVWLDHFASPKQRSFLRGKFEGLAKKQDRDWREVMADAYKEYHDRKAENPGWEPKGAVGQFMKSIYDFMNGLYNSFRPSVEGTFEQIRTGKEFQKTPVKGVKTGLEPSYIVTPEQAKGIEMETTLPKTPEFEEAVKNTPGASVDADGLHLKLVRFQKGIQGGEQSIRTGVFYLPEKASQARGYKTKPGTESGTSYGGSAKITGETVVRNPLVVKGATGGKVPEQAFDQVAGKGASKMLLEETSAIINRSYLNDVKSATMDAARAKLETLSAKQRALEQDGRFQEAQALAPERISLLNKIEREHGLLQIKEVEQLLESYGADTGLAREIIYNSQRGNQLGYALRENIIAHVVRDAGYDSVLGHRGGKFTELFDVREAAYPIQGEDAMLHPKFEKEYSVGPRAPRTATADAISRLRDAKQARPGVKGLLDTQKVDLAPRIAKPKVKSQYRKVSGGISRIDNFESVEKWYEHHKNLGFSDADLRQAIKAESGGTGSSLVPSRK